MPEDASQPSDPNPFASGTEQAERLTATELSWLRQLRAQRGTPMRRCWLMAWLIRLSAIACLVVGMTLVLDEAASTAEHIVGLLGGTIGGWLSAYAGLHKRSCLLKSLFERIINWQQVDDLLPWEDADHEHQ